MQISPIQQHNTSFKANMQLSGNVTLLNNQQRETLKKVVYKLGSKTDIVDINLSEKLANKGFIPVAVFANNKLSQFLGEFKNNDIYSGVINALEQTKEIFPTVSTVIGASLVVNKKDKVNDNIDKTISDVPAIEDTLIGNGSDEKLLEKIKTKIDDYIYQREHSFAITHPQRFMDILLINGIHNDSSLKEEYAKRMQEETYRYDTKNSYEFRHYTGDDLKDGIDNSFSMFDDSSRIIHHMLWEPELKSNIEKSIYKFLKSSNALNNFSIEELEDYYNKLNEKFEDFIHVATDEYVGYQFILKDHPLREYILDVVQGNEYLSMYFSEESKKEYYTNIDDNELKKAYEMKNLLLNCMFKKLLFTQLLFNEPYKFPIEKQKDLLDKIAQCTTRENTKEELDIIARSIEAEKDFKMTVHF